MTDTANLINEDCGLVCCAICNEWFGQITKNHLKYKHDISLEQYTQRYNAPTIADSKKNFGNKNPMKNEENLSKWKRVVQSDRYKNAQRVAMISHINSLTDHQRKKYNGWKTGKIDKSRFSEKVSVGVKKSYKNNALRILRGKTLGVIGKKKLLQRYNQKIASGEWTAPENKPNYIRYRDEVRKLTEETFQNHVPTLKNAKLRGKGWDLDHKISIHYGFKHNLPTQHIAHINNLEMLPSNENSKKGANCSMSYECLLETFNK